MSSCTDVGEWRDLNWYPKVLVDPEDIPYVRADNEQWKAILSVLGEREQRLVEYRMVNQGVIDLIKPGFTWWRNLKPIDPDQEIVGARWDSVHKVAYFTCYGKNLPVVTRKELFYTFMPIDEFTLEDKIMTLTARIEELTNAS